MLVSIIMPAYNAEKHIDASINSVLNQTYTNWELIIIDDGSTDETLKIIEKYKNRNNVFVLQHEGGVNLGVSKSRSLGTRFAKGEYIAFLDADDVFFPNKLENQIQIFQNFKDVILIHSRVEIVKNFDSEFANDFFLDENDRFYNLLEEKNWLIDNRICNSSVLLKSSTLKNIDFGLPQLFQYEDWLLWCLIAGKGLFYYQSEPQIQYRIHPTSATSAILKNKLISPYSKIEFLISFFILNKSNDFNYIIVNKINESLIDLSRIYSNNDVENVNRFTLTLKHLKKNMVNNESNNIKVNFYTSEIIKKIFSKFVNIFK